MEILFLKWHISLPLGNTAFGCRWVNIKVISSGRRPKCIKKSPLCTCLWWRTQRLLFFSPKLGFCALRLAAKEWYWSFQATFFSLSTLAPAPCIFGMLIALVPFFMGLISVWLWMTLNIAIASMRIADISCYCSHENSRWWRRWTATALPPRPTRCSF